MNPKNLIPGAEDLHKDWLPVLDLATREVFETMLASQLTTPASTSTDSLNVTAMVRLAGMLCGVMSVRCQQKAAALMASKMLGVELEKVDHEIADALGEICNMIAGNFKNKISGLGDGCMLSPPSVITGDDYTVHSQPESPTMEVSLLFESMPLAISLHIHS
ncbi:MAG: chemotaxis protein CheX [Candidatus Sulfotelmatobacter sp.]